MLCSSAKALMLKTPGNYAGGHGLTILDVRGSNCDPDKTVGGSDIRFGGLRKVGPWAIRPRRLPKPAGK